jgi:hypothetical protein
MLLLCIVKFGPTAQICAKTPKSETPFSLFSRTHARGLLMAHSTRFFPPICNRVNEASLRSPDHTDFAYSRFYVWNLREVISKFKSINTTGTPGTYRGTYMPRRYANSALAAGIILYICTVPVGMVYDVCTGYSYLYDIISCQKKVVRGSKTTFEAGAKKSSCMNL